jgi:hypothetical protein
MTSSIQIICMLIYYRYQLHFLCNELLPDIWHIYTAASHSYMLLFTVVATFPGCLSSSQCFSLASSILSVKLCHFQYS